MKKRITALLLSAALCIGVLGVSAFAAAGEDASADKPYVDGSNLIVPGAAGDHESGDKVYVEVTDQNGDTNIIKGTVNDKGEVVVDTTNISTEGIKVNGQELGKKPGEDDPEPSTPVAPSRPPVGPTGPIGPASPNVPVWDPSKNVDTFPFTDVKESDAWYDAVKYCYEHNMIRGTTDTTFNPKGAITRAQIVTILWRQAGAPRQTATGLFSDMPGDTDMYNAVIWAANLGIAKGYEDGKFYPARAINRQELATFLYRYETLYLGKTAAGSAASLSGYSDHTYVGSWAEAEMRWAVGNGVLPETSTSLAPTSDAPRYQAAMAMYRYCKDMLGID